MNETPHKKVLIADSQPNYIVGLRKGLSKAGFEVYVAEDGDRAFALVKEVQPDIILSEVNLPQLDGHSLLQAIRAEEKAQKTPFLYISNQKRVEERIKSISLGADDYIQKPYYVDEVIARIEMILKEAAQLSEKENQGSFSGKLSEMSLVDLIQTLEVGQKSGILSLKRNGKQGEIRIKNGEVVNANFAAYSGEKAMEKMFTWTEGSFLVKMTDIQDSKAISLNNKDLVNTGLQRLGKWERLKAKLPPLSAILTLISQISPGDLSQLRPEEQKLIQLMDGKHSLLDIIELSEIDDIQSLEAISRLFQKGYFKIKKLKPSTPVSPDFQNSEYLNRLRMFLQSEHKNRNKGLSLISLFLKQSNLFSAMKHQEDQEPTNGSGLSPVLLLPPEIKKNKTQFKYRIYLTKSELMMIREKLM